MSVPLTSVGATADLLGQEIDRLHGPVTLVRRSADLAEVLSVTRSGLARAVLVAEGAEEFVPEAMDTLLAAGVVVAVVEGFDDDRMVAAGAVFVPVDTDAREAAEILSDESQRITRLRGAAPGAPTAEPTVAVSAGAPQESEGALGPGDDIGIGESLLLSTDDHFSNGGKRIDDGARSRVVVVWGPHGSPGRSTVAVNLSAELAAQGHRVTLIDLDTWGPSVASLLGLLDEAAGVSLACRAADRNSLDPAALDRAAVRVDLGRSHIDVLTGLTRPDRWPELRSGSVRRLLHACRAFGEVTPPGEEDAAAQQPVIVVDIGFSLEEDEELSFDSEAPRRNAATLTALEEADLVLAVVNADVLGLPRAAKSLPSLMEATTASVVVVANKVRKAAAGRSPRAAVREAWAAIGAPAPISEFLSFDPATVDQAALDGSVLCEAAPNSALRRELESLSQHVSERLAGQDVADAEEEVVTETKFGRRLSGWLRR
ncbi:chromosome partitioning protein [Kocuria soli]|uniref:Chromosome partitioning protein n=1 Tax=Kocuria soli TaxID=2485125 RepID=A0A3N3ZNV4_9MICC|nr:P-loop NTPase [Kocuria soli]ROZ62611.1 chromosome partitioning protein [Kocuria soli]